MAWQAANRLSVNEALPSPLPARHGDSRRGERHKCEISTRIFKLLHFSLSLRRQTAFLSFFLFLRRERHAAAHTCRPAMLIRWTGFGNDEERVLQWGKGRV